MALVTLFAACALVVITLTAILNTLVFPRLGRAKPILPNDPQPFMSILIPARNEAMVIDRTVRWLLDQNYPAFEVLVLDDDSSDGTSARAKAAANGDPRLRVLSGEALPAGWLGKNWACHQLAQHANGDWLVFTDADVNWQPGALRALVNEMRRTDADLLTVWPTQQTESWTERLVVPLMALAILAYLPLPAVHHFPWPIFAAANGQCLAFRRRAYEQVGGHAAVKDRIVEDVTFARQIKARGLRLRMADGAGLIVCRMYRDWPGVRDGFSKNILAGHGDSVPFLAASFILHWLIFALPWLLLMVDFAWGLALVALGVGTRMLTALATRQRPLDALLMPVSVMLMSMIALRSVWWRWRYGGPQWKGRMIHHKEAKEQRNCRDLTQSTFTSSR